jgi:hypothetical protein
MSFFIPVPVIAGQRAVCRHCDCEERSRKQSPKREARSNPDEAPSLRGTKQSPKREAEAIRARFGDCFVPRNDGAQRAVIAGQRAVHCHCDCEERSRKQSPIHAGIASFVAMTAHGGLKCTRPSCVAGRFLPAGPLPDKTGRRPVRRRQQKNSRLLNTCYSRLSQQITSNQITSHQITSIP